MSPISKKVFSYILASTLIFALSTVVYALITNKDFFEIISQASLSCGIVLPSSFLMGLLTGVVYNCFKTTNRGTSSLPQIPKVGELISGSREDLGSPRELTQREIDSASIRKEYTSEEIANLPWLRPISSHYPISKYPLELSKNHPVTILHKKTTFYPFINVEKSGLSIVLLENEIYPYFLTEIYKDGTIKRYEYIYKKAQFILCNQKISSEDINNQLREMRISFPDFVPREIFWIDEPGAIIIRGQGKLPTNDADEEHYFFGSKERNMTPMKMSSSAYSDLREYILEGDAKIHLLCTDNDKPNAKVYISGIPAKRQFVNDLILKAEIVEALDQDVLKSIYEVLSNYSFNKDSKNLTPPGIFNRDRNRLSLVAQYLIPDNFVSNSSDPSFPTTEEEIANLPWARPLASSKAIKCLFPRFICFSKRGRDSFKIPHECFLDAHTRGVYILLEEDDRNPCIYTEIYQDKKIRRFIFRDHKFTCFSPISKPSEYISQRIQQMRIEFPYLIPYKTFYKENMGTIIAKCYGKLSPDDRSDTIHYFFSSKNQALEPVVCKYDSQFNDKDDGQEYRNYNIHKPNDIKDVLCVLTTGNGKVYMEHLPAKVIDSYKTDFLLRTNIIQQFNQYISDAVISELLARSPDKELNRNLTPPDIFTSAPGLSILAQYLFPSHFLSPSFLNVSKFKDSQCA